LPEPHRPVAHAISRSIRSRRQSVSGHSDARRRLAGTHSTSKIWEGAESLRRKTSRFGKSTSAIVDGNYVPIAACPRQQAAAAGCAQAGTQRLARRFYWTRLCCPHRLQAAMQSERFEVPVSVRDERAGSVIILRSARDAYGFLLSGWKGKRSDKHRAALQACSDAMEGSEPNNTRARRALVAAAREANIYVPDAA
jgi:hypothetical protein